MRLGSAVHAIRITVARDHSSISAAGAWLRQRRKGRNGQRCSRSPVCQGEHPPCRTEGEATAQADTGGQVRQAEKRAAYQRRSEATRAAPEDLFFPIGQQGKRQYGGRSI